MKRIVSLFVCLILIFSFSVTTLAASPSATLSGAPTELKKGATATVTVNLSGTPSVTSAFVQVTLGSGLELVSGQWKADGVIKDFTLSNGYGVLTLSEAKALDGAVFSFVIKGETVSATVQSVAVSVTLKNGSSTVATASANKSVKVVCATHTYGNYVKVSDTKHERTCSDCGATESKNHAWNNGTVTKPASCKEAGTRERTCTDCGAIKNENIAKTNNHNFGSWAETQKPSCTEKGKESRTCSVCNKTETRDIKAAGHKFSAATVTKQPTCTEKGEKSGKCTVCNKVTTQSIAAKGHKYGEWKTVKEATCTEQGEQSRKCSECNKTEKRSVDATGHNFSDAEITKEPTLSRPGEKSGKCEHCGEKTVEVIPPSAMDEQTGIIVSAPEGVFAEGSQLKADKLIAGKEVEAILTAGLRDIAQNYGIYSVGFTDADGVGIVPDEGVEVSIPLFDGLNADNTALYAANESGGLTKLEVRVEGDRAYFTATGGTYVLAQKAEISSNQPPIIVDDNTPQTNYEALFMWICIAVIVIIIGVVSFIIIKRKNR